MKPLPERVRGSRCCDISVKDMDTDLFERLSADFAILGHPVRLQILAILASRGGEVCVCDLERTLPVKQPTVSHHLRLLRQAGWVETARKGVWIYYFVRPSALDSVRRHLRHVADWLG